MAAHRIAMSPTRVAPAQKVGEKSSSQCSAAAKIAMVKESALAWRGLRPDPARDAITSRTASMYDLPSISRSSAFCRCLAAE